METTKKGLGKMLTIGMSALVLAFGLVAVGCDVENNNNNNNNNSDPNTVATPTASPVAGAVASGTTVTLSTTTGGATIHYTTNGSTPTESSPTYSTPLSITAATTIKAIAVKSGMINSGVLTVAYTLLASEPPPELIAKWYTSQELADADAALGAEGGPTMVITSTRYQTIFVDYPVRVQGTDVQAQVSGYWATIWYNYSITGTALTYGPAGLRTTVYKKAL